MAEINNIPFTTDENLESAIADTAIKGMRLDHFNYNNILMLLTGSIVNCQ